VTTPAPSGAGAVSRGARPGRRERLAFLVCSAIIGVHVLLNAFVFVEPGATRSEHILAALIPVAVIAFAAELYPRMIGGLRASLALVLGVLSLVAGGIAVVAAGKGTLAPAHWSAFLLLPAGVVLIELGVWILWTSRKRGGSVWWRVCRRALLGLAALLFVYWVLLPVGFAIVGTERPRDAVRAVDLGRPYQDVTIRTCCGLDLAGSYVPSQNGAAVITFPRDWTTEHARMLVRNGYGVLLLDPRGYGESEGYPNAYGWGSVEDIDAAVMWLQGRDDVEEGRIGGLGLSVGGEQMIETAGSNDGLRAVVSEGAGLRSARESFVKEGPSLLQLLLQYPQDLVQTAAVWVLSGETPPPSLKESAARIAPRAVFFIYGEDGQEIEAMLNVPYHAAAGEPKEIWEVPGAGHTAGISARPEEYARRVIAFFDRELLGTE